MRKNQKLGLILIGLLLVSITLFFVDNRTERRSFDVNVFSIADTSKVKGILVEGHDIHVQRFNGQSGWILNDSLAIDPSLIDILFVIMSQVEVQRPVSLLNLEEIRNDLRNKGRKVVFDLGDRSLVMYTGGNANKTKSYFADEGLNEIFIVAIPGYNNYLSGIFELTKGQWRSRELFNSNWRSLQTLRIDYKEGENLSLRFKDRFFEIDGQTQSDSTLLVDYVNLFEGFQLNDYLDSGSYERYDSLMNTNETATLRIEDIDVSKNRMLKIYPLIDGEKFHLLVNDRQEMIVIDQKRIEKILKRPRDFVVQ